MAIEVDADLMPTNVRDRSNLQLVVLDADQVPSTIPARAMEVPVESVSGSGSVSLSVEVDLAQSPAVATAEIVRVVLLPPSADVEAGDPPTSETAAVDDPDPSPATTPEGEG